MSAVLAEIDRMTVSDKMLVIEHILRSVRMLPQFLGNIERQNEFLRDLWIECDFGGSMDSVLAAHHAWYEHVLRKRKGEVAKRPIAEVMIGAYALSKGGLITRNEDDFRSLYPTLKIYNPATGGGVAQ